MNPLTVFCENTRLWLSIKADLVDDVRFLRSENADLRALVVKAQRGEADATRLMAESEHRARDLEELVAEQRLLLRALGDEEVGA